MISDRIKQLRLEFNFTQKELADKLHVTPKTISFYELGQRSPTDDIKIEMTKIFGVSMDYLMDLSDIKNPYNNEKKETSLDDMDLDIAAHKEGDSEFTESQMDRIAKIVQEQVERIQKEQNKDKE